MEFDAIVYTSQFGHTKRYAEMLGQITGKPVQPLNSALSSLKNDTDFVRSENLQNVLDAMNCHT